TFEDMHRRVRARTALKSESILVRVDAGSPSKWRATFEVLKLMESSAFSQLFLRRSRWPAFEGSDKHWWCGPFALVANGRQQLVPIEQPRNLLKNLGLVRLAGLEPRPLAPEASSLRVSR